MLTTAGDARTGKPTIALCMIVRDETAVLERCVASVLEVIDHWVVCDTGSVDGTPELAQRLLGHLPGTLHHRPWVDFGHNRSELMALARDAADYLLLLDADQVLRVDGPLPTLDASCYLLQHAGSLGYAVPRLVRGDRDWRYVGSTHEYLAGDDVARSEVLEPWVVEHFADGGSRGDKLERDRRLLERDLAHDPHDARTLFYLAQTVRDLGEDLAAADLYRRRVEEGGWDEEVFYARYQQGVLLARHDWDAAVPVLLDAWQLRPRRAEPLHELAVGYRARGQHHLAFTFASVGARMPEPADVLFVHHDVYDWGLRFELAIAAYWVGHHQAALDLNDELLTRGVPDWIEPWVRHNRLWCVRALGRDQGPMASAPPPDLHAVPTLASAVPGTRTHELTLDTIDGWPCFNPTLLATVDGFRAIVRSANYHLVDHQYQMLDATGAVRTRNYLVDLDADARIVDAHPLPLTPDGAPQHPSRVVGVEDCRLIEVDGRLLASGTVRDRNPEERCEIACWDLTDPSGGLTVLASPHPERHEKNWMPFVHDGALHFLYSCAPTVVVRAATTLDTVEVVAEHSGPATAVGFRGGSQGIAVDGGWLFVVHEVGVHDDRRVYVHRLVRLGHDLRIDAVSPTFCFLGQGVEFCAGLARRGDELFLSFGAGDGSAHVTRAPEAALLALLEPVD